MSFWILWGIPLFCCVGLGRFFDVGGGGLVVFCCGVGSGMLDCLSEDYCTSY